MINVSASLVGRVKPAELFESWRVAPTLQDYPVSIVVHLNNADFEEFKARASSI